MYDFEHEIGPGVNATVHYSVDGQDRPGTSEEPPEDAEFTIERVVILVDLNGPERDMDVLRLLSGDEIETLDEAAREDFKAVQDEDDEPTGD